MALRHVKEYYLQQEKIYLNMVEILHELEREKSLDLFDEERVAQYQQNVDIIKSNYERLAYILMLFNQPRTPKKLNKHKKQNKLLYNNLCDASPEYVAKESLDALEKIKELISEEKK